MSNSFQNRTLRQVAGPLLIENILRTTLTTVDVFMLSFYSEKAVAAVGLINQFVFFIQLMYLMVASGASILLAQYLGAGQHEEAHRTTLGSFTLGLGFSLVLSLALTLGAPLLVGLYALETQVHDFAVQFLVIYSVGSVSVALSMLQSTLLRVHGEAKAPMYINMVANVVNIVGNALFLFGWFGLPVWGVVGVALSTVFSQVVACVAQAVVIRKKGIRLDFRQWKTVGRGTYKQILAVGVPTAGENLSYNLAQMVNMRFVAALGTASMAAYVFLFSFLRYVFVSSISIGSAAQIKVGWWVGQGREDVAARRTMVYLFGGMAISLVVVLAINLFQAPLFSLFTQNPETLALISAVLLVSIFQETGRNFNLILIPALKGAGDVKFPVFVGIVFMWGIGVLGSWLFGVVFGWGLVGIFAALAIDEWVRGLIMLGRWKSGRWRGRGFTVPSRR